MHVRAVHVRALPIQKILLSEDLQGSTAAAPQASASGRV